MDDVDLARLEGERVVCTGLELRALAEAVVRLRASRDRWRACAMGQLAFALSAAVLAVAFLAWV